MIAVAIMNSNINDDVDNYNDNYLDNHNKRIISGNDDNSHKIKDNDCNNNIIFIIVLRTIMIMMKR